MSERLREEQKKKVFVGISGGVDSSVAAALLLEQGYEVVGVFMKTWQPEWMECTWRDERRDAMRVCAHLGIPFLECDLVDEYKKGVADYMIEEYKKGNTPNPDVMCNREVKFGAFLPWALERGADYVATGHYARSDSDGGLLRGKDEAKDQSYFLWTLTSEQLKKTLFPVGEFPKSRVRKIAEKFGLVTATKKDSQGICFIGDVSMKEFLSHYIETRPGNVLNSKGEVIGSHEGALFYTLGERHGFTVDAQHKGTDDQALYVVSKDIKANTITVSPQDSLHETKKENQTFSLYSVNDISQKFKERESYEAQIRYHGQVKHCVIGAYNPESKTMTITFDQPDFTVAKGQSIVLYQGEECLGGGIVQ